MIPFVEPRWLCHRRKLLSSYSPLSNLVKSSRTDKVNKTHLIIDKIHKKNKMGFFSSRTGITK